MDLTRIEELIRVLEGSRTEEISVRKGEFSVSIRKGHRAATASRQRKQAKPAEPAPETPQEAVRESLILAPMVGIFHKADGIPAKGSEIRAGQVVGTIESMKLLNDVVSDVSGAVVEVLVEEGTPVEYGQPLCRIEPA